MAPDRRMSCVDLRANKRAWLLIPLAMAVVLCGLVVLRHFEPTAESFYPKCMFFQWTGLHCPGCGGTRAAFALVQGDLGTAIRCNPLLVVGGPVIAWLIWWQRRRERAGGDTSARLAWALCAIIIAYFIMRNLPSPTRSPLAPPKASAVQQVSRGATTGSL